LVLQALVFASAAAGLVATGHRSLALVFGVIVVINAILIYVWGDNDMVLCGKPIHPSAWKGCSWKFH
jgi:hypothetical protein